MNTSICVQATREGKKVYANLTNGKTDRIYAIGLTKAIGKLQNYLLTDIKDFYIN